MPQALIECVLRCLLLLMASRRCSASAPYVQTIAVSHRFFSERNESGRTDGVHEHAATDLVATGQLCYLTFCVNPAHVATAIPVHAQGPVQGTSMGSGAL